MIQIVRDILDKKLLDKDCCEVGRVDGIVLEFPDGQPPRAVRLEIGGEILAARAAHWLVRPTRWLAEHIGPRRSAIVSIEWKQVEEIGRDLKLTIEADDTEALAWEHWLGEKFISKIPGGK
jgi:sporulation protein YlmC with PRC-barrel domain